MPSPSWSYLLSTTGSAEVGRASSYQPIDSLKNRGSLSHGSVSLKVEYDMGPVLRLSDRMAGRSIPSIPAPFKFPSQLSKDAVHQVLVVFKIKNTPGNIVPMDWPAREVSIGQVQTGVEEEGIALRLPVTDKYVKACFLAQLGRIIDELRFHQPGVLLCIEPIKELFRIPSNKPPFTALTDKDKEATTQYQNNLVRQINEAMEAFYQSKMFSPEPTQQVKFISLLKENAGDYCTSILDSPSDHSDPSTSSLNTLPSEWQESECAEKEDSIECAAWNSYRACNPGLSTSATTMRTFLDEEDQSDASKESLWIIYYKLIFSELNSNDLRTQSIVWLLQSGMVKSHPFHPVTPAQLNCWTLFSNSDYAKSNWQTIISLLDSVSNFDEFASVLSGMYARHQRGEEFLSFYAAVLKSSRHQGITNSKESLIDVFLSQSYRYSDGLLALNDLNGKIKSIEAVQGGAVIPLSFEKQKQLILKVLSFYEKGDQFFWYIDATRHVAMKKMRETLLAKNEGDCAQLLRDMLTTVMRADIEISSRWYQKSKHTFGESRFVKLIQALIPVVTQSDTESVAQETTMKTKLYDQRQTFFVSKGKSVPKGLETVIDQVVMSGVQL